jgi:hypothetical protein
LAAKLTVQELQLRIAAQLAAETDREELPTVMVVGS